MRALAVWALLLFLLAGAGAEGPSGKLLENADFQAWKDDLPQGWQVEAGARYRDGPDSLLSKGPEGGVRLAGGDDTGTWRMLVQRVKPTPGATCRLAFEARLRDARLDAGQRENRYVGVRLTAAPSLTTASPNPLRWQVDAVLREVWTPGEVVFRASSDAVDVVLFLSTSGGLEVRGLLLQELEPQQSFPVLVRNLERYYSYFTVRDLDWPAHVAAHAAAFAAARDETAFLEAAQAFLAPLQDTHVTLRDSRGRVSPTWAPEIALNVDAKRLVGALPAPRFVGRVGIAADLDGDLGYLAVGTLAGSEEDHAALESALEGLLGKQGLLLDLRGNSGGDEARAHRLVARLMDEPRLYAKRRFRSGPAATDFGPWREAWIRPAGEGRFLGPIVVLLGPGCVSSGEGMAKMLRVRPRTRLVGQPTQGASGNPQPLALPNGIQVGFSRWQDALPDGTLTEGRGVAPDLLVPRGGPGDMGLLRGLVELRRLVSEGLAGNR